MRRAVIFAHFHPQGEIPPHTRHLIDFLRGRAQRFILVSTGLGAASARTLPADVEVIVRPNVGHDFMSYKTGWLRLGDVSAYDEVLIVNDSIYLADAARLERTLDQLALGTADAWGLTASEEGGFHLQSYCIGLRRRALAHPGLADFWTRLAVLPDKRDIIRQYERGLSLCLRSCGLKLEAAFLANAWQQILLMARRKAPGRPVRMCLLSAKMLIWPRRRCNPTHFLWDQVLARHGILKLELLKRNPKGMALDVQALERGLSASGVAALRAALSGWRQ